MNTDSILLPGLNKQFLFMKNRVDLPDKKVLVIGSGSEVLAKNIFAFSKEPVELIVDNYESLMNARLLISKEEFINCSLMDYSATDFDDMSFDLVYAQASVTTSLRRKILKEVFRVLKPSGYFCVGELVKLTVNIPKFVEDILTSDDLFPVASEQLEQSYSSIGFSLIDKHDFSESFYEYLKLANIKAGNAKKLFNKNEISFHKKLLNRFSHEANSFLKHGGNKHIGFVVCLFQKGADN